jgi:hypothetical protein
VLPQTSFLIQKSPDQRSFASFPELIAGYHVFRRFSMPRHPPCTLKNLTTFIDHRRSGCPQLPPIACEGDRHVAADARSPAGRAGGRYRRSITDRSRRAKFRPSHAKKGARRHLPDYALKSDAAADRKTNQHGSRGAPTNWQVSWRFILQINLEPQFIHLSKSKLR